MSATAAVKSSTSTERSTTPLSRGACALLSLLMQARKRPGVCWITDREVAAELRTLPERNVIDYAYELMAHGWCVVTRTAPPAGRRLLEPGDDLAPARENLAALESRAREISLRARLLRDLIANLEERAAQQQRLFADQSDPRRYMR